METAERIKLLQEQVKKLSAFPFYQKRFQSIGLKPADIRSMEDFQKIPPWTPKTSRKTWRKILRTVPYSTQRPSG